MIREGILLSYKAAVWESDVYASPYKRKILFGHELHGASIPSSRKVLYEYKPKRIYCASW